MKKFIIKIKEYFLNVVKDKKNIIWLIMFVLLGILFFSFPIIFAPDTELYYRMMEIIKTNGGLLNWNPVRGFSMPLILYLITILFGKTEISLLFGMFIFYLLLLIFALKVLNIVNKEINKKYKGFIFFSILIIFNTLIMGYYHVLLTEFIASTFAMIIIYYSYMWLKSEDTKKSFVKYTLVFSVSSVFLWFLKQTNLLLILVPMAIVIMISLINDYKRKQNVLKIATFLIVIMVTFISIKTWNYLLINSGGRSSDYQNSNFLYAGIIYGNTNYRKTDYSKTNDEKVIMADNLLTKKEKQEIISVIKNDSKYKDYLIFNVIDFDGKNIIEREVLLLLNKEIISGSEAVSFWSKAFIKNPILVLNSYFSNYLAMINIYDLKCPNAIYYYPEKTANSGWCSENITIGSQIIEGEFTALWPKAGYAYEDFLEENPEFNKPIKLNSTLRNLGIEKINIFYRSLFSWSFLLMPIIFFGFLIKYIVDTVKKKKNKYKNVEELIILLSGSSFIVLFALCTVGSMIDRYAMPMYPISILCLIIIFIYFINRFYILRKEKNNNIDDLNKKNKKILVVIPAYNESENIGKVLDELSKDCPNYDVLVINDCSKDNTKEIVESKGIKCISHPFNMQYAKAVQTGIKYANENDYDYVIQFDADGQHIAKEIKKLIVEMKKGKSDIVLGSRFLVPTDYNHNFFRKIGTKIFSFLIKKSCSEKISDPTSGFQCLNKRVISRYSKMGNYPEFPDANLIIEVLLDGYSVSEVPVKMRLRESGESMHGGIIRPIKYMIKVLYAIMIIIIRHINYGGKNK